jgi:spermidine/putrescine ABC transporter ATP-binding subunit
VIQSQFKKMAPKQKPYLLLKNITKKFGDTVAVDDFYLEVAQGEFVTLLGPSGSGKTTTLNVVAGFLEPSSGLIEIEGRPMTYTPPNKRDIGMVFQNYALFPHMDIFNNLSFPLKMRNVQKGEIQQRVNEVLDLVKLSGYGNRKPDQLSGGQQQRIALARAVIFNPKVLLMDEPLGSLDKKLREYMQLEILRIHKDINITVVYVTHDQSEALTMSDRIVVMDHGKIQQVGSPQEIYDTPVNRFVAEFIGEINILQARIVATNGETYTAETDSGIRVRVSGGGSPPDTRRILIFLRPENVVLVHNAHIDNGHLNGVVEEAIYLGESIRYTIALSCGDLLLVKQTNKPGTVRYRAGDRLGITWEAGALRLVGNKSAHVEFVGHQAGIE